MAAPTLVLLHGVGLDHTVWDSVVDRLPRGIRIITPDLPGHGAQPPAAEGMTLAGLADIVAREIPAASHVVGFSLGALIGQHLAVYRPELVASLTSVSSVCRRTPTERAAVLDRLQTAIADFHGSVVASLSRWFDGTDVESGQIERTRATLLANDPQSFVHCYRVFATADAEISPQLGNITAPSLAVTGACDPGSTPEMTRRLASAIPGCEAVVVPDARHMLPVERPGELVDCLSTFVGRYTHV